MPAYFPMFVNLSDKNVRVYGAGRIAARRIRGLLRYGAVVTVVAPKIHAEIKNLRQTYAAQLSIEKRRYRRSEIGKEHADYVLAATDDASVNAMIYEECRKKQIPVNNASCASACDFYFPALVERDGLIIGVTSADGNHKKTARFCEYLRSQRLPQADGTEQP